MKNTTIEIKIDNFHGPLDLLLHLIEKKKMEINNINISKIIDDYLQYIKLQEKLKLEIKIDFLILATELLEIKAYSVLNKKKNEEKLEILEKRILEYKFFKNVSTLLSKYEKKYNFPYKYEGSGNIVISSSEYDLKELNTNKLSNLFFQLFRRGNEEKLNLNFSEYYTYENAKEYIKTKFSNKKIIQYFTLFNLEISTEKIVTIFLVILEMFKEGEINIFEKNNKFYLEKLDSRDNYV